MTEKEFTRALAEMTREGRKVKLLTTFSRALTQNEQREYEAAIAHIARNTWDLDELQRETEAWVRERGLLAQTT